MSVIVETEFGRFRHVIRDGGRTWLLECPGCGQWATLDDDQFHGRVSVDHAADGCPGGYHETHDYASVLRCQGCEDAPIGQHTGPHDWEPRSA